MTSAGSAVPNVTAAVPLLMVLNMEQSLAFYVDGLGFTIQNRWAPGGRLRWCWMSLDGAALMLWPPQARSATGSHCTSSAVTLSPFIATLPLAASMH